MSIKWGLLLSIYLAKTTTADERVFFVKTYIYPNLGLELIDDNGNNKPKNICLQAVQMPII